MSWIKGKKVEAGKVYLRGCVDKGKLVGATTECLDQKVRCKTRLEQEHHTRNQQAERAQGIDIHSSDIRLGPEN